MYTVYEMFYTLQGEGAQTGRAAVFCRFSGCNLWSGREQDRSGAICDFCDTQFVGTDGQRGGKFKDANSLAAVIASLWPAGASGRPYVVCTGGEPALQLDAPLVDALHAHGFEIAIETNGTKPLPEGIDWICVSPKAGTELVVTQGNELKLVYPQPLAPPERFNTLPFDHFFLQPMDGPMQGSYTARCIEYCMAHPQWRLSLQTHKIIGID
ncbi:Queuosine Biosynthesis QueE Radical SAM [Marinobacterium lacunae]|uniref:7-carboxy-7-deazaguanine synthase n=1 Tax=Marinobacterium lacunae TaxID=1232683 RepID=A0A081FW70_9GAMM|nr:7-carboxy-7-deazaguanine synthase [Marinobacterium lacunae]KEA62775.1 Queuosine Biosynthesis QueE Radical SAM [Marinobacterium lacunae]